MFKVYIFINGYCNKKYTVSNDVKQNCQLQGWVLAIQIKFLNNCLYIGNRQGCHKFCS